MSTGNRADPLADLEPASSPARSWGFRALGLAGGLVMSFLILLGISRAQKTSITEPPTPIEDLRAFAVESPPPPPPTSVAVVPPPPTAIDLQPQPEADGIKIAVVLKPQELAPPTIDYKNFELDPSAYKPRPGDVGDDLQHVYQPSEVDERPVAIYRKTPNVTNSMLESIKNPRATLLFVVNVDGTVENLHVIKTPTEEFGEIMAEAVRKWKFRPARRGGRKVRCLVQLPIFVRPPHYSPFSI